MIRFIGTLKSVNHEAKTVGNNEIVHTLKFKIELTDGAGDVEAIMEHMKEIIDVEIDPVQPKLTA